jgi:hypothetical protein
LARPISLIPHLFRLADVFFLNDYSPLLVRHLDPSTSIEGWGVAREEESGMCMRLATCGIWDFVWRIFVNT